jgi:hypothetical protein
MAQKMNKVVLGVVENMSYLQLPDMDKRLEIFGPSHAAEMAQLSQAPLLGQLPLDPELAKLCDHGEIEKYDSEIMKAFGQLLKPALDKKAKP